MKSNKKGNKIKILTFISIKDMYRIRKPLNSLNPDKKEVINQKIVKPENCVSPNMIQAYR